METCEHFEQASVLTTETRECAECVAAGSGWVHLRLCLVCGNVGCCDSSPNQHASKHAQHQGHPTMRSIEPEEDWGYCFVHDEWIDGLPAT